jgi:uncharacterized membrane protein YhdT
VGACKHAYNPNSINSFSGLPRWQCSCGAVPGLKT